MNSGSLSRSLLAVCLVMACQAVRAGCLDQLRWTRTHDGLAHGDDRGYAVAVDSARNVIVAGTESVPGEGKNWLVRKFDPAGELVWERTHNGPAGADDEAFGIAVDGSDNVIVAGSEGTLSEGANWMVRKYDSAGTPLWTVPYNSQGANNDYATAVAVDGSGNVAVAGYEYRTDLGQERDWRVNSYDAGGSLVWSVSYDGAAHSIDMAYAVAADSSGNVVVAGTEVATGYDFLVRKYDSGGNLLWSAAYDSPAHNNDILRGVAVDAGGNVYAAGYELRPDLGESYNWVLRKYDSGGVLVWSRTYNNPNDTDDTVFGMALDPAGNPIVVGTSYVPATNFDLAIRKWSPSGDLLWGVLYDSPGHALDFAYGGAVDARGDILVAGLENRPDLSQGYNWLVQKYGSTYYADSVCLSSALALNGGPLLVGRWVEVVLSVTNEGGATLSAVVPELEANTGGSLLDYVSGPVPAPLGPGASAFFTWTYSVSGAGSVSLTGTATGTDAYSGDTIAHAASASATLQEPPLLVASLTVLPAKTETGQWLTVTLDVENNGGTGVGGLMPFLDVNAGGSLLELPAGPSPAGPVALAAGGGSASFAWTFSVSGAGPVAFTATGMGEDVVIAATWGAAVSAGQVLLARAELEGAVAVSPAQAEIGQQITVALTVTNTGDVSVPAVTSAIQFNAGGGRVSPVSAPSPAPVGPGSSTTFQWVYAVTGAGPIAFTATGSGADGLTARPVRVSASGGLTTFTPAALVSALAATPAPGETGDWITIALTVTNTGEVTVLGVTPSGPVVTAGASLLSPIGGPSPTGPVPVPGGGAVTFAWTVSASGCGAVGASASAAGTDSFTGAPVSTGSPVAFALKGDAWDPTDDGAAGASVLVPSPAGAAHGPHALCPADTADWYRVPLIEGRAYRMHALSGRGDSYAELFADAAATQMTGADDDSGGALQFAIETTATVSGDNWLKVRAIPAGSDWAGYVGAREMARASLAVTPSPASAGQTVEIVLTVTNTGSDDLTGTVPALAIEAGASALSLVSAPAPATVSAGGSWSFTWSYDVVGAATVELTGSGTGTDAGTGRARTVFGRAVLTALAPSALVATASDGPDPAAVGQWITVALTVTNTGGSAVNGVAPSFQLNTGSSLLDPQVGVMPAGPVALAAGASQTFRWTLSVSGTGTVDYTVTGSGIDAGSGAPVVALASGTLSAILPARLETAVCLSPASVEVGRAVKVVMTVTNTGGFAALAVLPALQLNAGAAVLAWVDGPEPAGPVTLAPGARQIFTWTYTVTGASPLDVTGTVTGTDAATGHAIGGARSATGTAVTAAALVSTLGVVPAPVAAGQWVTLTLNALNTGGVSALAVTPSYSVNRGALTVIAQPGPATVPAGGNRDFVWTFSTTGAGPVEVTATATGSDAWTGALVVTAGTSALTVQAPAVLAASLTAGPDPAATGEWIRAVLTVTNTGEETAAAVAPALQVNAGGALLVPQGAVTPAGPVTIPAGGAQSFTWTYSVSGSGNLDFTGSATGTAALSGHAVLGVASRAAVTRVRAGLARALLIGPVPAQVGQPITVALTVTNTGGTALSGVEAAVQVNSGGAGLGAPTGPSPAGPVGLAAGAAQTFVWTYPVTAAGTVEVTVTAAGQEAGTGRPVAAAATGTIATAQPARLVSHLAAGPTPATTGDVLTVALTVTNAGGAAANGVVPALAPAEGAVRVAAVNGPLPAGPVGLAPGAVQTFVWTWTATGSGSVSFSATASGTDAWTLGPLASVAGAGILIKGDAWDPGDDVATGGTLLVPSPVWQAHGPHALGGSDAVDWYRVALVAGRAYRFETAGGTGDDFGQLFADPAGTVSVASDDDGAGAFQSRVDATAAATQEYYLRVTTAPPGGDWSGNLSCRELLAASMSVSPAQPESGRWFAVVLTVTNTAGASLNGPPPVVEPVPGGALVELITAPVAPLSLASGATASFAWTFSVSGAGPVAFSGTATGTDAATGRLLTALASAGAIVGSPAALSATVIVMPASPETGMNVLARLEVTNNGAFDATGVRPFLDVNSGGEVSTYSLGPTPAGPVTIPAGSAQSFTWTWWMTAPGTLAITATAIGESAETGTPVVVAKSAAIEVVAPTSLRSAIAVSPAAPVAGQTISVSFTVTNGGGADAVSMAPTITANTATTELTPASGPVPPAPVTIMAGGATTFVWTFTSAGAGNVAFTARAAGQDGRTGDPTATTQANRSVTVSSPAALYVWSGLSPYQLLTGTQGYVTLTVRNTGGSSATAVVGSAWVSADGGTNASVSPASVPAGPVTLAPGATQSFYWTWSATAHGALLITLSATGRDAQAGCPLVATCSAWPTIQDPSRLATTVTVSRQQVAEGEGFDVVAAVTNTGGVAAHYPSGSLAFTDGTVAEVLAATQYPPSGYVLNPGASTQLTWRARALRAGTTTARVTLTAQDGVNYSTITGAGERSLSVAERFTEDLAVWPNPTEGPLTVGVHLDGPADEVRIEVYNVAFKLMYEQVWRSVSQGADAQLPLSGGWDWVPGVYIVRAKVTYPGNRVVVPTPVKVQVRRR